MDVQKVIPILRIFDYQKAIEFYVDWLEFKIDWEHTFEENSPIYMQVSGEGTTLHLSEYHQLLIDKKYKNNKPGLEKSFYGTWCMEVIDPFGNRLTFNEKII